MAPLKTFIVRRSTPLLPLVVAILLPIAGGCHESGVGVKWTPERPAPIPHSSRPVATIDDAIVSADDMMPRLAEIGGAAILRALVLEQQLNAALLAAELTIDQEDLDRELDLLITAMDRDDRDRGTRLLDDLREREHQGPVRFDHLLFRNAALRALVEPTIGDPSNEQMIDLHEIIHGPRTRCRLIVTSTLAEAESILRRVANGEDFGDLAAAHSIDLSSQHRGKIPPLSPMDPAWPAAIRTAVAAMTVGERSQPILIGDRIALVEVIEELPADGSTLQETHAAILAARRLAAERVAMERLAQTLIGQSSVTIFDPHLRRAWELSQESRP